MNIYEKICNALFAKREEALRSFYETKIKTEIKSAIKEYRKSFTVSDMVRENLKMFNPRQLVHKRVKGKDVRADTHILDQFTADGDMRNFLSETHNLHKNSTLRSIVEFLIEEQIMYTALDAHTIEQQLLAQHNINGILLVLETIDELEAMYQKKKVDFEDEFENEYEED